MSAMNFSDQSLNGMHFVGPLTMSAARFDDAKLSNVVFQDLILTDCRFDDAQLDNVVFENVTLDNVSFDDATLNTVKFIKVVLRNCTFNDAKLNNVIFTEVKIEGEMSLDEIFQDATLNATDITGIA